MLRRERKFLMYFLIIFCIVFIIFWSANIDQGHLDPVLLGEIPSMNTDETRRYIRYQLLKSELLWLRSKLKRADAIKEYGAYFESVPWGVKDLVMFWDFFVPAFNCPTSMERIGRFGDGGKWICGLSTLLAEKKPCVVYSFGISDDVSFEKEILDRSSHCVVRMFDHTIEFNDSNHKYLALAYPTRASFNKIGLGIKSSNNSLETLRTFMEYNQDTFIDILKIDIEGGEFEVLRTIIDEFRDTTELPFGQLQVELHLASLHRTNVFQMLSDWFSLLEGSGLRAFLSEPNQIPLLMKHKEVVMNYEYSFLNPKKFNSEYALK